MHTPAVYTHNTHTQSHTLSIILSILQLKGITPVCQILEFQIFMKSTLSAISQSTPGWHCGIFEIHACLPCLCVCVCVCAPVFACVYCINVNAHANASIHTICLDVWQLVDKFPLVSMCEWVCMCTLCTRKFECPPLVSGPCECKHKWIHACMWRQLAPEWTYDRKP